MSDQDPYGQQGQPQQYGQQYPQSPYPGHGVANRTNTMAILSLVFAFVFFPLGIVLTDATPPGDVLT